MTNYDISTASQKTRQDFYTDQWPDLAIDRAAWEQAKQEFSEADAHFNAAFDVPRFVMPVAGLLSEVAKRAQAIKLEMIAQIDRLMADPPAQHESEIEQERRIRG